MSLIIDYFKQILPLICSKKFKESQNSSHANVFTCNIMEKPKTTAINKEIDSIISNQDPYEIQQYTRSIIRETCDFTETFFVLQKTISLEKYQELEAEIIHRFKGVTEAFTIIEFHYHFLLEYLTTQFLNVLKDMLYCPHLVSKGSFELFELIMLLRVNLASISQKWKSNAENYHFISSKQDNFTCISDSILNETNSLLKQMHIRSFVNYIFDELEEYYKLTISESVNVKRRAQELDLLLKFQEFYQAMPIIIKENHFLLVYLLKKLQKLIKNVLSNTTFCATTSNEMLQTLAYLNCILTFNKKIG